jgi:hypothetical protein
MNQALARLVVFVVVSTAASAVLQAQEPEWSVRLGAGFLVASDTSTTLDTGTSARVAGAAPVLVVDAMRRIDSCCLDVVFSVVQPSIPVTLAAAGSELSAGRIGPTGYQVGLNYRFWRRNDTALYAEGLVGGFIPNRSDPVQVGNRQTAFRFAGTATFGGGIGLRRRLGDPNGPNRNDRRFALDVSMRVLHADVPAGENDGLNWHPFILTAGLVVRLR